MYRHTLSYHSPPSTYPPRGLAGSQGALITTRYPQPCVLTHSYFSWCLTQELLTFARERQGYFEKSALHPGYRNKSRATQR